MRLIYSGFGKVRAFLSRMSAWKWYVYGMNDTLDGSAHYNIKRNLLGFRKEGIKNSQYQSSDLSCIVTYIWLYGPFVRCSLFLALHPLTLTHKQFAWILWNARGSLMISREFLLRAHYMVSSSSLLYSNIIVWIDFKVSNHSRIKHWHDWSVEE